ncbi:50S ribosomal protein L9 [symbiont of Argiope bruennichi]|uniref:50S ribosomal protein L9 n=1 Tax=symbiont of Argiope bruennichi TaxID=2810479 RepID=UPI003DA309D8
MKVILTKDQPNLGKKGSIIEVKDGFFFNFLKPNNLAMIANEANLKNLQKILEEKEKQREENLEKIIKLKDLIESKKMEFFLNMKDNKIFGSVNKIDLINCLKNEYNIKIGKNDFLNFSHFNTLGDHTVIIKLPQNIKATLTFEIKHEN